MAGYRLTLKKLAKKYGVDIEGSTYKQVVEEIVKDNVNRASKKMGEISNRRYKQAFQDSINKGIIQLPEYALPLVTVRKASQDGKMITDTLRDTLVRGLRKSIADNPNDTEKAIAQMAQSVSDDMKQYQNVHSKVIAVTEVRSAVDLSKYEYAKELINRNQGKIKVTKKWVHNDHLVKIPRPTHKAIDGEVVPFGQNFSIGLAYPHDPSAKAEDVIGCQCGYQIEVEEMATNEILKELKEGLKVYKEIQVEKVMKSSKASINPATGKPYQIGETKTRADGTKWVKTGTFSWAKAGTADAEEAQKKDTNKDGKVDDKDKKKTTSKKTDTNKKEWTDIEGQSAQDALDIAKVYGEKGIYQLTKGGLLNFLHANGVEDPTIMKWQEKVDKYKEIVADLGKEKNKGVQIQTAGKEEFTDKDFHILHNSDLCGDISSLENKVLKTLNGDVTLKFDENGGLTDQTYDELMQKVDPIRGQHWGAAMTNNTTALAVALVNAPEWKPIDKTQGGQLAKYYQELNDEQYMSALVKGIGLRKFAQDHLKHPDMSREVIPNFYRGMTVDSNQYEQILRGEVDTIELTGCTAVSSFEAVADRYAGSSWTKSFGAGRRSVKLIIERDDYMDNSIGMFHPNVGHFSGGNSNQAFELLSGSPSLYIKSVGMMGGWSVDKSITNHFGKYDKTSKEDWEEKIKNMKGDVSYDKNNGVFIVKTPQGDVSYRTYNRYREALAQNEACARMSEFNDQVRDWCKEFYKNNVEDLFKRVKNNRLDHRNNDNLLHEWHDKMKEEFNKTPMGKKYSDIINSSVKYGYELANEIGAQTHYRPFADGQPDPKEMEKIDSVYENEKYKNYANIRAVKGVDEYLSPWKLKNSYDDWRDNQPSKYAGMTMKMYLNKQKPLEKSYATQMKKTEDEYNDYKAFNNWKESIMDNRNKVMNDVVSQIKQKYGLTDEDMKDITRTNYSGQVVGFHSYYAGLLSERIGTEKSQELKEYLIKLDNSIPSLTSNGISLNRKWSNHFDVKDNPFLTDEMRKSPFIDKSEEYTDNRWEQLLKIRKKYEDAKKNNELSRKYNIANTPHATITKMRDDAVNALKEVRDKQKDYLIDKYNELSDSNLSQDGLNSLKESYKQNTMPRLIRDQIEKVKDELTNDKIYSDLIQEIIKANDKYDELTTVDYIYRGYNEKMADAHKSSKPLELHVVCGRGKKALSASVDDDKGEENGNN